MTRSVGALGFPNDLEILLRDESKEAKIAGLPGTSLPSFEKALVGFLAGSAFGQFADEIHPILTRRVFQGPRTQVRPAVTDGIGVVTAAQTLGLYPGFELFLHFGIEDVHESNSIFSPVIGNRNQVIPTLDEGHILTKWFWATIPVGIEAHCLTGFRKLLVIQSGVSVAGMGDSMGEERLTVRFDQPMSSFDDLNLESGFPPGVETCRHKQGKQERKVGVHSIARPRVRVIFWVCGERERDQFPDN